jgi:hypothetical protein
MTTKNMPLDEHALIGLELCAMSERLWILAGRITNCYGPPVGNLGYLAVEAVDRFRDALSHQLLQVCPKPYEAEVGSVYHCADRLKALRSEHELQIIGQRILGIA